MISDAPLADRGKPIEFFDRGDWVAAYSLDNVARTTALSSARMPFQTLPILAFWSFDSATGALQTFDTPCALEIKEGNSGGIDPQYEFFLQWTDVIRHTKNHPFSLADILTMIKQSGSPADNVLNRVSEHVIGISDHLQLEARQFASSYMCALYDRRKFSGGSGDPKRVLHANMRQIYDYQSLHAALWRSLPRSFLTSLFRTEHDAQRALFGSTKNFDPVRNKNGGFRWPWQSCLVGHPSISHEGIRIEYQAIPTTSIVVDLRHSTVAMNLTRKPEEYAEFIDSVVSAARKILVREGGFFDKETGDGLVGHFCHHEFLSGIERPYSAVQQAFVSGREIVKAIRALCVDYQDKLFMGIGGLGAAVGIHTDSATWLAGSAQVRAIGPSVVVAARLCSCAVSGQILLSNHAFQLLRNETSSSELALVKRTDITMQEYAPSTNLYAYAIET